MTARLDKVIDEALDFMWRSAPVTATVAGIHEHDGRLSDCAPEAIEDRRRRFVRLRDDLRAVAGQAGGPDPERRLDAEVLGRALEVEARLIEEHRPAFRDPAFYLDEILYGAYCLLVRDFAPLAARAEAAARRLHEVPRLLEEARRNLGAGNEVPPEWLEAALRQMPGGRLFLADLQANVAPRAGAAGPFMTRGVQAATAALDAYEQYLKEVVAPHAAGPFAAGRSLFEFLLHAQHGVEEDADALRRYGEGLVRHTRQRLEETLREVAAGRSWAECLEEWKDDHPDAGGLIEEHRREAARARAFVLDRGLVTLPPGERLEVTATPPFQRTLCPFAAYLPPGPFEERREGELWITPPADDAPPEARLRALRDHPRAGIPATIAHEAYPGHHVQLSALAGVPSRVRRYVSTPVFVEGWAFYCEELVAEEGYYEDPRSRVLQLKDQLWRACRVVIDAGLHTGTLGFDGAVRMLCDVAGLEEPNARGEVLRYTRSPTQPLSYAVGKREILRLREDCRRAWGPAFSLRAFHDRLLAFGSIPLSLIGPRMLQA